MPTGWKQCQALKGERPKEKSTNKIVNILGQDYKGSNQMRSEDEIKDLCKNAMNECDTCNGDPEIDCIDCTQGGKAILAHQILELLQEDNQ